jgi:hypothetical protein
MPRPYWLWPPPHLCSAEPHPALPCGRLLKRSCHGIRRHHPALQRRGPSASLAMLMNRLAITGRGHPAQAARRWPARTHSPATLMWSCPLQRLPVVPRCPGQPAAGQSRFDVAPGGDRPLLKAERRQPRAVLAVFRRNSRRIFAPAHASRRRFRREPTAAEHATPLDIATALFRSPPSGGRTQPGRGLPPQQRS